MKKAIAFFDFDGTITTKDSLFEIVKFSKGTAGFYSGILQLSPWLVAMKLKLISNQAVKEKFLAHFFGGTPLESFQKICDAFCEKKIPQLIRPGALVELNKLKANNTPVAIVSASPENWLKRWCSENNFFCIATQLEIQNDTITGKIMGNNCYGEEKVRRIKEQFNLSEYNEIFCFGDTKGDKPMLALATSAYYKPFR